MFHKIVLYDGQKELHDTYNNWHPGDEIQMTIVPCKFSALNTLMKYCCEFEGFSDNSGWHHPFILSSPEQARKALDLCDNASVALMTLSKTDGWTSDERRKLVGVMKSPMAMWHDHASAFTQRLIDTWASACGNDLGDLLWAAVEENPILRYDHPAIKNESVIWRWKRACMCESVFRRIDTSHEQTPCCIMHYKGTFDRARKAPWLHTPSIEVLLIGAKGVWTNGSDSGRTILAANGDDIILTDGDLYIEGVKETDGSIKGTARVKGYEKVSGGRFDLKPSMLNEAFNMNLPLLFANKYPWWHLEVYCALLGQYSTPAMDQCQYWLKKLTNSYFLPVIRQSAQAALVQISVRSADDPDVTDTRSKYNQEESEKLRARPAYCAVG